MLYYLIVIIIMPCDIDYNVITYYDNNSVDIFCLGHGR